jgi:predicted peptidase
MTLTNHSLPAPFLSQSIKRPDGDSATEHRYVLLPPSSIDPQKTYPLVLFLHGAGERGTDLSRVLAHFPVLMATVYRNLFPAFVLIPQCQDEKFWARIHWKDPASPMADEPGSMMKMVMAILDHSIAHLPIDPTRLYLTGLSMGGFGSWELAIRRPNQFAAVAPICGGGDPLRVPIIKNMPIWAFHGADDDVVDVEHTRRLIRSLHQAGGQPLYTEFPHAGHHSWTPAYDPATGLLEWMFRQRRP